MVLCGISYGVNLFKKVEWGGGEKKVKEGVGKVIVRTDGKGKQKLARN